MVAFNVVSVPIWRAFHYRKFIETGKVKCVWRASMRSQLFMAHVEKIRREQLSHTDNF